MTPLLAMAEQLAADGASFALHYAARAPERMAFRDRLAAAHLVPHARCYFDNAPAAERLDLAAVLSRPDEGTHLYACGPAGFIEAALAQARALGWPEANLHREYFGAAPQTPAVGKPETPALSASGWRSAARRWRWAPAKRRSSRCAAAASTGRPRASKGFAGHA